MKKKKWSVVCESKLGTFVAQGNGSYCETLKMVLRDDPMWFVCGHKRALLPRLPRRIFRHGFAVDFIPGVDFLKTIDVATVN